MKKIIIVFLMGVCAVMELYAKTAFVYFSATGKTEQMAKDAASAMGADIFEIEPTQAYTKEDLNWRDKNSRAAIEHNDPKSRPEIANVIDISEYNTVILCYPIWWSHAPKIMYTFAELRDWNGKKLITLCTSGGGGLGRSGSALAKHAKGAIFKGGKDCTKANGAEVKRYVEELLK